MLVFNSAPAAKVELLDLLWPAGRCDNSVETVLWRETIFNTLALEIWKAPLRPMYGCVNFKNSSMDAK